MLDIGFQFFRYVPIFKIVAAVQIFNLISKLSRFPFQFFKFYLKCQFIGIPLTHLVSTFLFILMNWVLDTFKCCYISFQFFKYIPIFHDCGICPNFQDFLICLPIFLFPLWNWVLDTFKCWNICFQFFKYLPMLRDFAICPIFQFDFGSLQFPFQFFKIYSKCQFNWYSNNT